MRCTDSDPRPTLVSLKDSAFHTLKPTAKQRVFISCTLCAQHRAKCSREGCEPNGPGPLVTQGLEEGASQQKRVLSAKWCLHDKGEQAGQRWDGRDRAEHPTLLWEPEA